VGIKSIELSVYDLLVELGYDASSDPHFLRTPERVATWLMDFAKNSDESKVGELLGVVFPENVPNVLVIVGPVEYRSMCAHHLLPVVGSAWVGYLPEKHVCGLSKLARLVEFYATQLTVQERVTNQIAEAIVAHLEPKGCMVVVKAEHHCMSFRGIRDSNAVTTTSAVRGLHETSPNARAEFLSLVNGR